MWSEIWISMVVRYCVRLPVNGDIHVDAGALLTRRFYGLLTEAITEMFSNH